MDQINYIIYLCFEFYPSYECYFTHVNFINSFSNNAWICSVIFLCILFHIFTSLSALLAIWCWIKAISPEKNEI